MRETASKEPLYPDERALVDKLFAEKSELKVSRSDSNSEFMNARFAAAQSLKQDYAGLYFKRNLMYLVPGFVLSLMALYEVFPDRADINDIELVFFMSIFVLVWSVAVTFLAWLAFSTWRQNREETEDKDTAGTVLIYVITGIFWIAESILWSVLAVNSSFIYASCIFLVAVVNAVFGSILRRHTSVGRQLLDRIECFEQWLKDETVHRFAAAGPEEASRRFERFLPYAMALNREAEWSSEFESALETAATEETTREYEPYWYRRRQTPSSSQPVSIGSFMTAFSESFNRAVNTASTTASSSSSSGSSGSGGGGSSGGGSGGGGGGGW